MSLLEPSHHACVSFLSDLGFGEFAWLLLALQVDGDHAGVFGEQVAASASVLHSPLDLALNHFLLLRQLIPARVLEPALPELVWAHRVHRYATLLKSFLVNL